MSTMNEGQRNAFIDLLGFVADPDSKFHRVSGGAGTGKTFFISKVAEDILKHKPKDSSLSHVAVTATTNKAAAVLGDAMPHRKTNIQTIYSFMNLRVSQNFTTGEQKIVPTRNWGVHDGAFIIIDEASMVSRSLMEYIKKGTSSRCKILFVGDKNQLSPVKEDISPVYSTMIPESLLLKPVRNAEQPALMDLCEQAKQTVLTGKFTKIQEVPGVIDFIDGNQTKGILEREYSQEVVDKRVLCYTNSRVIMYNQHIRTLRGYTEPFNVGEILTNNTSAELLDKTKLYTDQMVEVTKIHRQFADPSIVPGFDIPMVEMEIQDVNHGGSYTVTCFYNFEDRENVLKHYSSRKNWHKFFSIRDKYPDLRSVAASTTHKAQGSTYSSVIVDLADIGKSTNREQTARLQYVALSRPKTRLYVRGELPPRYFE